MDTQAGPLETELRSSAAQLSILPSDRACLELALTYARAIDLGDDLAKIGPALLACLAALGMTPAARAALAKGGTGAAPTKSPLDELRAKRAARAG